MFGLNLMDRLRSFNRQRIYKRGLNKPFVSHPDGFMFSGRNQIMAKGGHEPFEAELVRKILQDVQVFVNIGAHHGYYSCLALSCNTDTIAYEPEASNILMLEKHIKANDFSNKFTLHPCAVGSQSSELVLYGGGSGGSLLPNTNLAPKSEQQTVSVVTLDDTLSLGNKKVLCLMDVEGFEHEALKGASKLLSNKVKPYWIIEVLPCSPQGDLNAEFENVFELMRSHGYCAWAIDEGANQLAPFTSDEARKVKDGELKTNISNFLFTERDDDLALRLL
jgi:FkbM family methyltransferase